MLLFRSLAMGLLGACLYLIADVDRTPLVIERPVDHYIPVPAEQPINVVDVGHNVSTKTLLGLIRMGDNERIVEVGEHPVANDLVAALMIADTVESGATYIDLSIGTHQLPGRRRVLLLLH